MFRTCLTALLWILPSALAAQGWETVFERSGGELTPSYDETIAYCRRLDSASAWVRYSSFGRSPQGRDLPLLVLAKDETFTPEAAARTAKVVVLVQSGIHAGEIDGKDASLMLMRDIGVHRTLAHLLDHTVLLFVPILNVDGHERSSPYNRINQNGPAEMGWRVTAQNLNLNRDYMKADAPEMRALLGLFTAWLPHLYVDCHVTDGIDFQYDITYTMEYGPNIDAAVGEWIRHRFLPDVLPAVEAAGHPIFWYVAPREDRDLSMGLGGGAAPPRFSTGYAALHNRPALLIETHSLKPYRVRVSATYQLLKAAIATANARAHEMLTRVAEADRRTAAASRACVPLRMSVSRDSTLVPFRGVASTTVHSDVSGGTRLVYTGEPFTRMVPFYANVVVDDSVCVPHAYVVPPEWTFVPDRLRLHGITFDTLKTPETRTVESYIFHDVRFAARPYEGRQSASYRAVPVREKRVYPAGSIIVPTTQRGRNVLVHLFEPSSGDSFVAWGFFNAIFERKEYFEPYVMERIGAEMLAQDSLLAREFRARLAADSVFARSPRARLEWLYDRSPWADGRLNLYPVGRVGSAE
jgi:hypothetical protein